MKQSLAPLYLVLLLGFAAYCGQKEETPSINIQIGDVVEGRGKHYQYVKGNVLNAKGITIDYLEGNIAGEKTRSLFVNVMRGNIEQGAVTVNVLNGDIIDGENVTVNVLNGRDFSGKAKILKKL
ncbi:MAG: hypothetical protein K8S54_11030 [Spirochaetia bacterium]|nr:hypothetical protein [Spirochaetia bacterium]